MHNIFRMAFLQLVFIAVVSLACNLPQAKDANISLTHTLAFMTITARIGQAVSATPTLPAPTTTPFVLPATSTQPASNCDKATFLGETIPDDSVVLPNSTFTKTWTLKNTGSCAWGAGYALVYVSGTSMGMAEVPLPSLVEPGQTVVVSITLTAPATPGKHRAEYKLKNASGALFGIGKTANNPFWVQVIVSSTASVIPATAIAPAITATTSPIDFINLIDYAPKASWKSCEIPCGTTTALAFSGPTTNPKGFAEFRYNATLEDGRQYPRVLETHPPAVDNGTIFGIFKPIEIHPGYHFKTKIGFIKNPNGTCTGGDVNFQVSIFDNQKFNSLGSWKKTCDGTLTSIDIDLSGMAGESIQLALFIISNGSPAGDSAAWIDTRIEP